MPTVIPTSACIYHRGLVGSAILRRLAREGYTNLLTARLPYAHCQADQIDLIKKV